MMPLLTFFCSAPTHHHPHSSCPWSLQQNLKALVLLCENLQPFSVLQKSLPQISLPPPDSNKIRPVPPRPVPSRPPLHPKMDDDNSQTSTSGYCYDLYTTNASNIGMPDFINKYTIQSVILIAMLAFQALQKYRANELGIREAADRLILGVYYYVFFYMCSVILTSGIAIAVYSYKDSPMPSLCVAFLWSLHHFGTEGITFLLLHHGVGNRALLNSFLCALAWGAFTFVIVYQVNSNGYDMDAVFPIETGSSSSDADADSDQDELHLYAALSLLYSGVLILLYGLLIYPPPVAMSRQVHPPCDAVPHVSDGPLRRL